MSRDKIAVAMIRHMTHQNDDGYTQIVYISQNESDGTTSVRSKEKLPKYDMSKIKRQISKFNLEDFDQEIYNKILMSSEGHNILNELKNEKTEKRINEFTTDYKNKCNVRTDKICRGDGSTLINFLNKLLNCKLEGNNLISNKSIGLTKPEIWNRFKEKGLVAKFQTKI